VDVDFAVCGKLTPKQRVVDLCLFIFSQIRSKLPGFRPGLSALNVGRAADVLKKLDYHGPLALSWDDTALEQAILVHAESKDVCLILGAANGTIRVTEKDDLDDLFEKAQLQKADKVRYHLIFF
jgi:basic membrane lipoprotein Med (substrate-binding protein (PBP1-ABC) superfamily)